MAECAAADDTRPLVVHLIYRLDVGGLENGVVNLINTMPADRFRHAVVCMTEFTEFRGRIRIPGVSVHALNKPAGKAPGTYVALWRLLRRLRPMIVHTRNLATLEGQVAAAAARVPVRVHGEHGWDVDDLHASSARNRRLRRVLKPLVHRHVAVSRHLAEYLEDSVGVPRSRISQIYNGVDTIRFRPGAVARPSLRTGDTRFLVGTVGRLAAVKDQPALIRAFAAVLRSHPEWRGRVRLAVIGDGALRAELEGLIREQAIAADCVMAGSRDDIPDLMREMDLFVLPSLAEGISNTILEAMATGLPVIATRVGGNPELVSDGLTGRLVGAADPGALADAIAAYVAEPDKARSHGREGRSRVERQFSLGAMVAGYLDAYDAACTASGRFKGGIPVGTSAGVPPTENR